MTETKKSPVGAPRLAATPRLRRNVMIDDDDLAIILAVGEGNQSAGVHTLVEFYQKNSEVKLASVASMERSEIEGRY